MLCNAIGLIRASSPVDQNIHSDIVQTIQRIHTENSETHIKLSEGLVLGRTRRNPRHAKFAGLGTDHFTRNHLKVGWVINPNNGKTTQPPSAILQVFCGGRLHNGKRIGIEVISSTGHRFIKMEGGKVFVKIGDTIKLSVYGIFKPSAYYHVTGFTVPPQNLTLLFTWGLKMLFHVMHWFDRASITDSKCDLSMERHNALFEFLKKNASEVRSCIRK